MRERDQHLGSYAPQDGNQHIHYINQNNFANLGTWPRRKLDALYLRTKLKLNLRAKRTIRLFTNRTQQTPRVPTSHLPIRQVSGSDLGWITQLGFFGLIRLSCLS